MKYLDNTLSEKHKELNKIIRKKNKTKEAKQLFLDIHARLNEARVSNTSFNEVDQLIQDLTVEEYAVMPTKNDETIAWVLWHIARIEDITMNILVAKQKQIFNEDWQTLLHCPITDTGNALNDDEIIELSHSINIQELLNYRNEVAKQTRKIVSLLTYEDMIRKVDITDIHKIKQINGVTDHENSIWLLDFWSKKDVAGLLLMPPTRHVMLHLNNCIKWKEQIRSKKFFYRQ